MKVLVAILTGLLLTHSAFAHPKERPATDLEIPATTQWGAIGAGTLLGFGLGQAIEDRYAQAGWPFTVADGAGWIFLLASMGDCGPGKSCGGRDTSHAIGLGLLIGSRVVQVGELLVFGANHGLFGEEERHRRRAASVNVLPTLDGKGLSGTFAFDF